MEYWTSKFRDREREKMKKDFEDSNFEETLDKLKYNLFDDNDYLEIDPESIQPDGSLPEFYEVVTPKMEAQIKEFYSAHPELKNVKPNWQRLRDKENGYTTGSSSFHPNEAWIQTNSGIRFNPLNPIVDSILIQDIAHSLAMQCRFNGHTNSFYSVAQHSVGVSYLCDSKDALWGLLHDATEAYLCDIPSPLKITEQFSAYRDMEDKMEAAICERFELPKEMPDSVRKADHLMLATEARDLLVPLRKDWVQICDPIPFIIKPLPPFEAKDQFLKRFSQLIGK